MSQSVDNLQAQYTTAMFHGLRQCTHLLPTDLVRIIKIAESLSKYPGATAEELSAELGGPNWVIARRSRRIVERYGEAVICVTHAQFREAEARAVAKRFRGEVQL